MQPATVVGQDVADAEAEIVPTYSDGYFPTIQETELLGGDYPRSRSRAGGPDQRNLTSTDIFPYPNPARQQRNAFYTNTLSGLNPYIGFFAPREGFTTEGDTYPEGLQFTLDGGLPLFTRDFNPERAHLKAGPLYVDFLYLGISVLYSDYDGVRQFADGEEDGWLFGIDFGIRALLQITDQFFLSVAGDFVYLPMENRFGFRLGTGGRPMAFASLNYQLQAGTWDFRFYNTFSGALGLDLFADANKEAFQRSGRYSFGFQNVRRTNDFWDGDNAYFTNAIGAMGSTPIWTDWRLNIAARHTDTWETYSFENRSNRDEASIRLGYNGTSVPFSPYAEYIVSTFDDWDEFYHRIYVGANGRITENLSIGGRVGYLFSTGDAVSDDRWLWNVHLSHQLTQTTWHGLSAGQDFFTNDLTNDNAISSYVRYDISQQFTRRLSAGAYAQYSEDEGIGDTFTGTRWLFGTDWRWRIFNGYSSAIRASGYYEHRDEGGFETEHWLGRIGYTQQILSRLQGDIYYQYEEEDTYHENVIAFSLKHFF